ALLAFRQKLAQAASFPATLHRSVVANGLIAAVLNRPRSTGIFNGPPLLLATEPSTACPQITAGKNKNSLYGFNLLVGNWRRLLAKAQYRGHTGAQQDRNTSLHVKMANHGSRNQKMFALDGSLSRAVFHRYRKTRT